MNVSADLIEVVAQRAAAIILAALQGQTDSLADQTVSPLGPLRHCAAVRRRIDRGQQGASIVGRRHLLTPEALQEELATATTATRPRRAGRLAAL